MNAALKKIEMMARAAGGEWCYCSFLTRIEMAACDRLASEGWLEARLGWKQGWIKAN